ncbi:MAG: hypothetical protein C5S41_12870 [Candidatus Methanomarinus sp.]|nr:MAG: hypothetical protein C5S41_12870 [ANME-2 cluster archaeon]
MIKHPGIKKKTYYFKQGGFYTYNKNIYIHKSLEGETKMFFLYQMIQRWYNIL